MIHIGFPDDQPQVPTSGMAAVFTERTRQIVHFGHAPEDDLQAPLAVLPTGARNFTKAILDDIQFNKPRDHMRRHAIRAAAMLIAFIDRLDAEASDA
jgi:hypothetical protein